MSSIVMIFHVSFITLDDNRIQTHKLAREYVCVCVKFQGIDEMNIINVCAYTFVSLTHTHFVCN